MIIFIRALLLGLTLSMSCSMLSAYSADKETTGGTVPSSAENVCPIKSGQTIPDLTLADHKGNTVSLGTTLEKQPSILIFYRGSWCPYCNIHLGEMQKLEPELKKLGYQIIAVSPDLPRNLKASVDRNNLNYRLLSDSDASLALALGLAFQVDKATREKYIDYGIDLKEASGQSHYLLPVPAAIVVDTKKTARFVFANPNFKTRIDNDVLIAAARAALK